MNMARTSHQAIHKIRLLANRIRIGQKVLANHHFQGTVEGVTTDGKVIVKFDQPVTMPTVGWVIERSAFDRGSVEVL